MATLKTVSLLLANLSVVFQERTTSEAFFKIYHEDLKEYPDHVLAEAIIQCRRTCRFFPTISEIRDKADPILQKWTLENRRLLAENEYHKCHEHVYIDDRRNPHCILEDNEPEKCKLAGTGHCGKWKEDIYHRAVEKKVEEDASVFDSDTPTKGRDSGGSEQEGRPVENVNKAVADLAGKMKI
jgi:hypothetical protein